MEDDALAMWDEGRRMDRIAKMDASELREELDMTYETFQNACRHLQVQTARIDELEAENARLRGAS
jgi:hypothetical protein